MAGYLCTFKSCTEINGVLWGEKRSPVVRIDCASPAQAAQEAAHVLNVIDRSERIAVMEQKTGEITYWTVWAYTKYAVLEEREATA